MYRIPLVKNIIFLENQHALGKTYIPIIGFPDPNNGIKAINYNKLPSPIVSSSLCRSKASLVPVRRSKHRVLYTKSKGI